MFFDSLFLLPLTEANTNNRGQTHYRCLIPTCPVHFTLSPKEQPRSLPEHHHEALPTPLDAFHGLSLLLSEPGLTRSALQRSLQSVFMDGDATRWKEFLWFCHTAPINQGSWFHKPDPHSAPPKTARVHRWKECAVAHSEHYDMTTPPVEIPQTRCPDCCDLNESEFRLVLAWKLWNVMIRLKFTGDLFNKWTKRRDSDRRLIEIGKRDHRGSQKEEIPFFLEFLNAGRSVINPLKYPPLTLDQVNSSPSNRNTWKGFYEQYREALSSDDIFPADFRSAWSEKFRTAPPPAKRARRA